MIASAALGNDGIATPSAATRLSDAVDTVAGVRIRALGRTAYVDTWRAMQSFTDSRADDTPDEIWLTEHPPVYTLGLGARPQHVLRSTAIPIVKVDRGGQVTYHGPGQLLAYLMFDLRRQRVGVRALVRSIENAVIEWLGIRGVRAHGKPTAPGVYVHIDQEEAKIAALGLKIRNGCSYHGVSVNIAMDLQPFSDIDPCGYPGLRVTQLVDLGVQSSVAQAGAELAPLLARHLLSH
ncbi:MAG TPA: lipoyl(octanoyl) transferase LipB [Casimicrobiaceae bacterium]|nr:lipoyl(octanoyl) transferase LipB [Casimicrobiaceae bacterium]